MRTKGKLTSDRVVRAELHVVMGLDGDDVREEVATLKREVLNDEVERVVGVLDTRDGDVSNLLNEGRHDNAADIVPELGLELE